MAARFSAIDVLDAIYRLDGTPSDWLHGIVEASAPALDRGRGLVAFTTTLPRLVRADFDGVASSMRGDPTSMLTAVNTSASPALVGQLTRRAWVFSSMSEVLASLDDSARRSFEHPATAHGFGDALGLFVQDGEGGVSAITAPVERPVATSAAERAQWSKIAVHLGAMARLRRRLERTESAVLTPDGRVVHAASGARAADARELLVRAARSRERSRGKLRREEPEEALTIWRGLVDGRWSLVDRFESDGSRWIVAYPNAPDVRDPRRLSAGERRVVHFAMLGASNKEIAYALGISLSTVAGLLSRAFRKLRIQRRSELVTAGAIERARTLRIDGEALHAVETSGGVLLESALGALTSAERDLVERIARGATDAEIAKARGSSVRTVSNQVARLYKKLGVRSRSELTRFVTVGVRPTTS